MQAHNSNKATETKHQNCSNAPDERLNAWMDAWMDGWMDGWMVSRGYELVA